MSLLGAYFGAYLGAHLSLTLALSGSGVWDDEAVPPLRAGHECIAFDAVIQSEEGELDDSKLLTDGWTLQGAMRGERWYLTQSRGSQVADRVCYDGTRFWIWENGGVTVYQTANHFSRPFEAAWLPYLLQMDAQLRGPGSGSHEGLDFPAVGWERSVDLSTQDQRTISYTSKHRASRDNYRHTLRSVAGAWFCHRMEWQRTRVASDRSETPLLRVVTVMEEPFAVGDALAVKKMRTQAWTPNPRLKSTDPIDLARTTVGVLRSAVLFDPAAFDAQLALRTTLALGTKIIDYSHRGVLTFTVGERDIEFDGLGYELVNALAAPPSDAELMEALRTAKREPARDSAIPQVARALGGGVTRAVVRSQPTQTTSGDIVITPGRCIDLGLALFGDMPAQARATFALRNVGDTTRTIESVTTSSVDSKVSIDRRVLAPGEVAIVTSTLFVARAETCHTSVVVEFAGDGAASAQREELQVVAIGVPQVAIRATALTRGCSGEIRTIVCYSRFGEPAGDIAVPKGAESIIASDSGWLPVGASKRSALHWIRDIVKKR